MNFHINALARVQSGECPRTPGQRRRRKGREEKIDTGATGASSHSMRWTRPGGVLPSADFDVWLQERMPPTPQKILVVEQIQH